MVVRSEDVGFSPDINNLPESAGAIAALNAKANFQRCPHLFNNPIDIRRALIAKREMAGAETAYGHTCSNIIEILDNLFNYERPAWAADVRQTLPWMMNQQIERLERLTVSSAA